ncbi:tyrosine-type recombinase/integrase [Aestuariivita sp.]|jgi:hypothetical protein|uniref:tyrosine-type recombinase/integrase n=1 Tax=Aestuariivita sp. TaxID=1872407 RepID=UPI00216EDE84|nr:tyrosine-type recombinase/integrase [Aestuariivita sp.]MCE8006423.1 tyrosine-type recombinase/integrase [Aestuariivita sp.]
MKRQPKPRITKPHLTWKWNRYRSVWEPYHRITWTQGGKTKERAILLRWEGDRKKLDDEYWLCEAGQHLKQKAPAKYTWGELVKLWRTDPRVQSKLKPSSKLSYARDMDFILAKNKDKDVRTTTRAQVRAMHSKYADRPRKADKLITTVRMLWNYAEHKQDWPMQGKKNPAAKIDLYGRQKEWEPWPDWMIEKLPTAPEVVQCAAELILGTGQRPNAAITMRQDDFSGEWMWVLDEKGTEKFEVYCPDRLRGYLANRGKSGAFVIAKNLTEPVGYDAVEKAFRKWRASLEAKASKYVLHGLRKLAIVQLAEGGCTDAQIQAITNQSVEMIAYYRKVANRKKLSRSGQRKRET